MFETPPRYEDLEITSFTTRSYLFFYPSILPVMSSLCQGKSRRPASAPVPGIVIVRFVTILVRDGVIDRPISRVRS